MPISYKVQKGDSLGKIAKRFYGEAARYPLIVAANRIQNPDRLPVGQELVIPDLAIASAGLVPLTGPAAVLSPGTMSLNEARLARLHPILVRRGRTMVELCALAGIPLLISQGLRTWLEQDALYAKGRTIRPIGRQYIVTKARGGRSYHNFGLAFDVVVLDSVGKADWDISHAGWARAAGIGKSVGLEWGGEWQGFKDVPHFQYTGGVSLAECRELFKDGLEALWARVT